MKRMGDHDLPTLREAPAALLPCTMFLRVVVGLVRQCFQAAACPGMGRLP
jgi:hypothetical protein